ncbi:ras GTP-binding protein Rho1-like [Tropilaelaps mercedesae]|uniref:Ras GTP-binding protein Rho1-like n=1 Tax=Tropilaelaps mercedesae TaxID=418985 RepID=A0A1V9XGB1_9ACAR|nr:ras GTP-binding protein Rho1-like [Tropilaelaps mercedesae]
MVSLVPSPVFSFGGTRVSSRNNPQFSNPAGMGRFVNEDDGRRLAGYIKVQGFVECSALTNVDVPEVLNRAALLSTQRRRKI